MDKLIPRNVKFMKEDVRLIDMGYHKRFIVTQDIFKSLDRLSPKGQIESADRRKLKEFMNDLDFQEGEDYIDNQLISVICDRKKTPTTSKARNTQEVGLINIENVPIILTQFKPKKTNKDKVLIWSNFMKFVNKILKEYNLCDYIIDDKEQWKADTRSLGEDTKIVVIANRMTNINMAKLIGVYNQGIKQIRKDELKIYQPDTSIDLLAIRQELYHDYIDAYLMFNSKHAAMAGSLNKAIKKYKLDIELEKVI